MHLNGVRLAYYSVCNHAVLTVRDETSFWFKVEHIFFVTFYSLAAAGPSARANTSHFLDRIDTFNGSMRSPWQGLFIVVANYSRTLRIATFAIFYKPSVATGTFFPSLQTSTP